MVILITYGMKYFTVVAVYKDSILARKRTSVHMCVDTVISESTSLVDFVPCQKLGNNDKQFSSTTIYINL